MSGEESQDKQFEPTPKKLQDARKKGDVAKSVDVTTATAYAGIGLVALGIGAQTLTGAGELLQAMLANAPALAEGVFAGSASGGLWPVALGLGARFWPWFIVPAVLALLSIIAQQAFVVASDKLVPKISRISPISNAKNKYGRSGLFEFAKSFVKLVIYSTLLAVFLVGRTDVILASIQLPAHAGIWLMLRLTLEFFFVVVLIAAAIGAVDLMWQRAEHVRKNRMTRKEIMDEAKQTEGDPHLKQKRRAKAEAIAGNQMMAEVPKADVVIVNPTHYAVALKWARGSHSAPVCVAKGVDAVALQIRRIADKAGVPTHHDPPTARAIYASVQIDQEIRQEHFRAVAAAIRFADAMKKRARSRIWQR